MKAKTNLLALILLCNTWNFSMSQGFNPEPASTEKTLIGLKASLPNLKENEGSTLKGASGTYTLYSAIPVGRKVGIYAEVPFIYYKDQYESESGFGNIFITTRYSLDEKRTSHISLGLFLPTITDDKYYLAFMGLMSNYYRFSQMSQAYTIYGNYSFRTNENKNYILGGEIGPEVMFPKTEGETELMFHISLMAGWRFDNLSLWAELNDILIASEPFVDLNESNLIQLVFCGQYNFGVVSPGLCYMLPVNDYLRDYQSGAVGVKVDFNF